nr:MAG TPA: hypothetical protein [Caudoviricetes sp.]
MKMVRKMLLVYRRLLRIILNLILLYDSLILILLILQNQSQTMTSLVGQLMPQVKI